jgi:hypothetical protein
MLYCYDKGINKGLLDCTPGQHGRTKGTNIILVEKYLEKRQL